MYLLTLRATERSLSTALGWEWAQFPTCTASPAQQPVLEPVGHKGRTQLQLPWVLFLISSFAGPGWRKHRNSGFSLRAGWWISAPNSTTQFKHAGSQVNSLFHLRKPSKECSSCSFSPSNTFPSLLGYHSRPPQVQGTVTDTNINCSGMAKGAVLSQMAILSIMHKWPRICINEKHWILSTWTLSCIFRWRGQSLKKEPQPYHGTPWCLSLHPWNLTRFGAGEQNSSLWITEGATGNLMIKLMLWSFIVLAADPITHQHRNN